MKVVVLNDGETYTDIDGCFVLQGTSRQIDLALEEGRDYDSQVVGEITIPVYKITKVHPDY